MGFDDTVNRLLESFGAFRFRRMNPKWEPDEDNEPRDAVADYWSGPAHPSWEKQRQDATRKNLAWKHARNFDADDYIIWYNLDQQERGAPPYVSEILGYQLENGSIVSKDRLEAMGFTGWDEEELTEHLFPQEDPNEREYEYGD